MTSDSQLTTSAEAIIAFFFGLDLKSFPKLRSLSFGEGEAQRSGALAAVLSACNGLQLQYFTFCFASGWVGKCPPDDNDATRWGKVAEAVSRFNFPQLKYIEVDYGAAFRPRLIHDFEIEFENEWVALFERIFGPIRRERHIF